MNLLKSLFDSSRILNRSLLNSISSSLRIIECNVFIKSHQIVPSNLLAPSATNIVAMQTRAYKAKVRLRKRCKSCYFVWRNGRLYVECESEPRHKQFHKTSMLRGYDSVAYGYDVKAEKANKLKSV